VEFAGIDRVAVIVAAVASFVFGAVYYRVLGKQWMAALGRGEEDIKGAGKTMPIVPMIIALVAQLLMAHMLAGLMGHLGVENFTAKGGAISAFFVWGGFVVTTMAVNYAFQGSRRSLWVIDGLHWLGVLVVQGVVIGLFGV
jgi:hypothetical protein